MNILLKNKLRSYFIIDKILIIYTLAILFFLRFLPVPEIVRGFLASTLFFILPVLVGKIIIGIIEKIWTQKFTENFDSIFLSIFHWSFGSIFLLFISYLLSLLDIFNLTYLIIISCAVFFIGAFLKNSKNYWNFRNRNTYIILMIFLIGIIATTVLRSKSPFPFQVNHDMFQNLFIINRIIEFDQFSLFPHDYTEYAYRRFDIVLFNLLVAISSRWALSEPLSLLWSASFIQIPLYGVFIYLFAIYFTKNKILSFMASFIGIWAFESLLPMGLLKFLDDSLIALIFPYLIISLDKYMLGNNSFNKKQIAFFGVIFVAIFFIHPYLGLFVFSLSLIYLLINRINFDLIKYISLIIIVFLILLRSGEFSLISYKFNLFNMVGNLSNEMQKFAKLEQWYTPSIFYLSIIGLIICSITKKFNKLAYLSLFSLMLFLLYFLPTLGPKRIALYLHPLIGFFISVLFASFIYSFPYSKYLKAKLFKPIFVSGIIIFLTLQLIPVSVGTVNNWVDESNFNGIATSFTNYELEMGKWIGENTPKDAFILSEPVTQQIIKGISCRESFGRVYMLSEDRSNILVNAIKSDDSFEANRLMLSMVPNDSKNRSVYFILSGRVITWINRKNPSSNASFAWFPNNTIDHNIKKKFDNSKYFKLVHTIDDCIFLYEVLRGEQN